MFTYAQETPEDWWQVEALYDTCFVPGRTALSSYRLREGVEQLRHLSRLAWDRYGILAGAVRFWPVRVGDYPCLLLGPIAVHPTRQGEGLGGALIEQSLEAAVADTWERVLLVGDAPYYGRFGFRRLDDVIMPPPTNPERVLGRGLVPGAWDGVAGTAKRLGQT
ncbi:MAG: N-acetyltransferase [Pseudomonadota bacterium]